MAEEPEPTFEDALTRVERIVEDLERGEPSLSAALAKYEDGVKLLRRCYDLLDQAERSVALLTGVDEQGHPTTAPFDAAATPSHEPEPSHPLPPRATPARARERRSAPRPAAAARDASETPTPPSEPTAGTALAFFAPKMPCGGMSYIRQPAAPVAADPPLHAGKWREPAPAAGTFLSRAPSQLYLVKVMGVSCGLSRTECPQ